MHPARDRLPRSDHFGGRTRAGCVLTLLLTALVTAPGAQAGTLRGTVRFQGTPPKMPTVYMAADPACDKLSPDGRPAETVVVDPATGGLANVLLYIQSGLDDDAVWPPPAAPARLDQKNCMYAPHVFGVRVGQEIEIHSADPTFHNVDARTKVNTPFNIGMPGANQVIRRSFSHPEVAVKLKCDIHPWMSAYVGVFTHPFFAVSAADGSFTFPTVPEGEYTVEAWHELFGVRSATVEVDDEDPATVDFTFAGN